MAYRIEPNVRSKTKATVLKGRYQVATVWIEDPSNQAYTMVNALLTIKDLRELADELEKWEASHAPAR